MTNSTTEKLKILEEGIYEIHVTVTCNSLKDWERFQTACEEIGVKAIRIVLPEGEHPSHLITGSYHRGTYPEIQEFAEQIADQLTQHSFVVTRIKIEAMLRHSNCFPKTDGEALNTKNYQYFEFHVKARVSHENDIEKLREISEEFGVHLSRSASSRVKRGRPGELRFITARYRKVGSKTAEELFQHLITRLQSEGFELSNKLLEWTIYDSNLTLDRGWDNEIRKWADEPICAYCPAECPFEEEVA